MQAWEEASGAAREAVGAAKGQDGQKPLESRGM